MTVSVAIASPYLDQSKAIARLLLLSKGREVHLCGVVLKGESRPIFRGPFHSFEEQEPESLSDVIPTGGVATEALLRRGDIGLGSVTMTKSALNFYSKPWSLALAAEAGVPIPVTWSSVADDIRFPVFYKSSVEGGRVMGLARVRGELPEERELIFQEYINSPGTYGVGFIAKAGKIVVAHIHYERESYPELGGSAVIVERFRSERLMALVQAILGESGYNGWGLVEFKFCPRRQDFVFMELNAKLWASCIFAFRNEPEFGRQLLEINPTMHPAAQMVFVHRAIARGWGYTFGSLPKMMLSAEREYGEGAWLAELSLLARNLFRAPSV